MPVPNPITNPAATFVPRVDLPVLAHPRQPHDFLELLSNERNLLELRNDTDASTRLLQEFVYLYGRLRDYGSFCVLLDFDVISHFVSSHPFEQSQAGLDSLALDIFFIQGRMPYALPLGAYRELLRYLRHLGLTKKSFPDGATAPERQLNRDDVIREILRFIRINDFDSEDDLEELAEETVDSASGSKLMLARLLSIFLNDRFVGVRKVYNTREKDAWKRIQEAHPRKWQKEDPSEIIENDSINLSIALSDFLVFAKTGKPRRIREGYLLLSRTGAVFNFLRNISRNREMFKRARDFFECDLSDALRDEFPIITPQRLALVEWFAGVATPNEAAQSHRLAEQYMHRCLEVVNDLQQLLNQRNQKDTFDKFYKARQKHLVQSFSNLVKVASQVRAFEEKRRMLASVRESSMRMLGEGSSVSVRDALASRNDEATSPDPALLEISSESPRILDQIQLAIHSPSGPEYSVAIDREDVPVFHFRVFQRSSIRDEVLQGEVCLDPKALGQPDHFVARWEVTTSEIEFRSALADAFEINPLTGVGTASLNPTILEEAKPGDACWREGVVISTDLGQFGTPLTSLPGNWKWLDFSYLGRILENKARRAVTIKDIVVNLHACRIHYEAWPREGEKVMSLTSMFDLSQQVAALVYHSTHYYTDAAALAVTLEGIFRGLKKLSPPAA